MVRATSLTCRLPLYQTCSTGSNKSLPAILSAQYIGNTDLCMPPASPRILNAATKYDKIATPKTDVTMKLNLESFTAERLFLTSLIAVTSHKFLDSTSSIDQFLLTGIKRVAECTNFNVNNEMVNTIDVSR